MSENVLLARLTCPNQETARKIAEAAIEKRLAACANIDGPVSSTYLWKGVVEQAFEHVLWLKTTAPRWDALAALVAELHPYDVPALVAMPCSHVLGVYGEWLEENTKEPTD